MVFGNHLKDCIFLEMSTSPILLIIGQLLNYVFPGFYAPDAAAFESRGLDAYAFATVAVYHAIVNPDLTVAFLSLILAISSLLSSCTGRKFFERAAVVQVMHHVMTMHLQWGLYIPPIHNIYVMNELFFRGNVKPYNNLLLVMCVACFIHETYAPFLVCVLCELCEFYEHAILAHFGINASNLISLMRASLLVYL